MNSVGQLKEYHDKHSGGGPPVYTFQPDLLNKQFIATCLYCNAKTFGTGSSKKDSQRIAAEKMLKILNVTPKTPVIEPVPQSLPFKVVKASCSTGIREVKKALTEDEKQKALRFLSEYGDKDPNSDARKFMAPELRLIDDVDMCLKNENAPKSATLASGSQYGDAIDTFKQIMKEMKMKFYCKVPKIKQEVQMEHIVLIQIYYVIHLMAGGTGNSVELATYAACEKAITMLKVYTN